MPVTEDTRPTPGDPPPSDRLGPYRLLERLGEGGFGEVWSAEQLEPVRRRVAVKLIKPGMDSRPVLARFEAERQALALMDHPGIARVFDAGVSDLGRPWFSMELVRGPSITSYANRRRLSVRERLELFVPVCRAVQHAHQKGLIHRDLKPGNILVAEIDGRPMPKVIDFGIAKALYTPLTDKTIYTLDGHLVGTLGYMSPEQADGRVNDIDTRADVYGLGVILYELLTGRLPIEAPAGPISMREAILVTPPHRPSTRVGRLDPGSRQTITREHAESPEALSRRLRGDLDWIALKCLEKDRSRRYATADALAEDIERHLAGAPVTAGPPSATYRARKFIARHRVTTTAGAAVVAAMIVGVVGLYTGMREARRERDAAFAARAETEAALAQAEAARAEAERAQTQTERLYAFLNDWIVRAPLPDQAGRDVTVLDAIKRALGPVGEVFGSSPFYEGQLRAQFAAVLSRTGEDEAALTESRRAEEVFTLGVVQDPRTLFNRLTIGVSLARLGDLDAAESVYAPLEHDAAAAFGADHPFVLAVRASRAEALVRRGDLAAGLATHREVLAVRERTPGVSAVSLLNSRVSVVGARAQLGEGVTLIEEARRVYDDCVSLDRDNELRFYAGANLLHALANTADRTAAREGVTIARELLLASKDRLALDSSARTAIERHLAACLALEGDPAGAETVVRDAIAAQLSRVRGRTADRLLIALRAELVAYCLAQGRLDEASAAWSALAADLDRFTPRPTDPLAATLADLQARIAPTP